MIARVWKGTARAGQVDAYLAHLRHTVVPELRQIPGFRGVEVLRRRGGDPDVIVITKWESMDAIRRFAGDDPDVAVVAPAAQQVLASYDRHVDHFDIVTEST